MIRIAHPILVLDADRHFFTVLVEGGGEDVEPLAEDVVFDADRRESSSSFSASPRSRGWWAGGAMA